MEKDALKHTAKSGEAEPRRELRLIGADEGVAATLAEIGWAVAHDEPLPGDILLADPASCDSKELAKIRLHRGPTVALLSGREEQDPAALVALGFRHFARADDRLLLAAALEAATAGAARSGVGGEAARSPRRREQDGGEQALLDWLSGRADEDAEASLLMVDLSAVRRVNAVHGIALGDLMLLRASRRLAAFSRRHEIIGAPLVRLAGARFALAIPNRLSAERLDFLANELLAELARPYHEKEEAVYLSASVAAATLNSDEKASAMLARLLTALKGAEARAPAVAIADRPDGQLYDEHQIEKDLRHAIGRGEIEIVYQPQFSFRDERLVGAEALARWNHAKYGALGARVLFAVAERSDFLLPLSHYIQERALGEAAEWSDRLAPLRLSLNVTAEDLAQPKFRADFLDRLAGSGFAAERLTVEITESGLMRDVRANARHLADLRGRDIAVAIDDFGTGYSSLARIKELPLDYLKLDQGLTADILGADRSRIVVRAAIALGQALGLQVVAEGVESEEQRELLAEEGCDIFQGFLRSRPLGPAEFEAFAAGALA